MGRSIGTRGRGRQKGCRRVHSRACEGFATPATISACVRAPSPAAGVGVAGRRRASQSESSAREARERGKVSERARSALAASRAAKVGARSARRALASIQSPCVNCLRGYGSSSLTPVPSSSSPPLPVSASLRHFTCDARCGDARSRDAALFQAMKGEQEMRDAAANRRKSVGRGRRLTPAAP